RTVFAANLWISPVFFWTESAKTFYVRTSERPTELLNPDETRHYTCWHRYRHNPGNYRLYAIQPPYGEIGKSGGLRDVWPGRSYGHPVLQPSFQKGPRNFRRPRPLW